MTFRIVRYLPLSLTPLFLFHTSSSGTIFGRYSGFYILFLLSWISFSFLFARIMTKLAQRPLSLSGFFKSSFQITIILLITAVLAEGLLRLLLFAKWVPSTSLRRPELYAGYSSDDDYWRLQYQFDRRGYLTSRDAVHPLLGWSQDRVTKDNRLGLMNEILTAMVSPGRKIPIYGDSFVRGSSEPGFHIPRYTTRGFYDTTLIDFSVGGYGFDQIYLMFEQTKDLLQVSDVIVGVLTEDLDRTVLSFRTYQKPYFEVESENLILRGVPIDPDPEHYWRSNPPGIHSYLLALLVRKLAAYVPELAARSRKLPQKKGVSVKIIEQFEKQAKARNVRLLFLLFYREGDLRMTTWQEALLKEELGRRGIPFLDTKPLLLAYADKQNLPLSDFYVPDGHHNNLGNQRISESLHAALSARGYR